ncbi:MAG: hypothetical protein ACREOS_10310, partial [Candidatus Dormibacteraceae bacterium]
GREVELMSDQVVDMVLCPSCGGRGQVKESPVVRYVDLPMFGTSSMASASSSSAERVVKIRGTLGRY